MIIEVDEIKCQKCGHKMRPIKIIHKNESNILEYSCMNCNSKTKKWFEKRNEETI